MPHMKVWEIPYNDRISLARAALGTLTGKQGTVLRSSLDDWFPECVDDDAEAIDVSKAIAAEMIRDDFEFNQAAAQSMYRKLAEHARRFAGEMAVTHLEYAQMLGMATSSIDEVAQAWASQDTNAEYPLEVMEDMRPPRTLSKLTVARLSAAIPNRAQYSSTDLVYLLVKPYARSLSFGEPINAESISQALRFEGPARYKLPEAVLKAKALIDYTLHEPHIAACYHSLDRLKALPVTPDGLSSFIDFITADSKGHHAAFLKECLNSEHPDNLPRFFSRNDIQGEEVETLALESRSYIDTPDLVADMLPEWIRKQYEQTGET